MPCQIQWYAEKRVVYQRLYGNITLEDVRYVNQQSAVYLSAGIPLVHVIVNLTEVEHFPTSLGTIREMLKAPSQKDATGWVLIYGADNPLLRFVASMVAQLAGEKVRLRMVDDLAQAVEIIRQQDETLADLPLKQPDTTPS